MANLNVNAPRSVNLANMRPTAKSLWDKLRKEEAKLREVLDEKQDLAVELHALSGTIIRIGWIAYDTDSNDTLLVQGIDRLSGETCRAIVPVQSFFVIFRIGTLEGDTAERGRIGFHVYNTEDSE